MDNLERASRREDEGSEGGWFTGGLAVKRGTTYYESQRTSADYRCDVPRSGGRNGFFFKKKTLKSSYIPFRFTNIPNNSKTIQYLLNYYNISHHPSNLKYEIDVINF